MIILGNRILKRAKPGEKFTIYEQKYIHTLAAQTLIGYSILRVPILYDSEQYIMERVDTSKPIILGTTHDVDINILHELRNEFKKFFVDLWRQYKIAACGFELYLQSDGTVVMLGMNKFKLEIPSFDSSFPPNFDPFKG